MVEMHDIKGLLSYSIKKCIKEGTTCIPSRVHTDDIMNELFIFFINQHDTVLRWTDDTIYVHTIHDGIETDMDLYMNMKVSMAIAITSGHTKYTLPPNHTSHISYWITVLKVMKELRDSMWVSINIASPSTAKIGMRWFC